MVLIECACGFSCGTEAAFDRHCRIAEPQDRALHFRVSAAASKTGAKNKNAGVPAKEPLRSISASVGSLLAAAMTRVHQEALAEEDEAQAHEARSSSNGIDSSTFDSPLGRPLSAYLIPHTSESFEEDFMDGTIAKTRNSTKAAKNRLKDEAAKNRLKDDQYQIEIRELRIQEGSAEAAAQASRKRAKHADIHAEHCTESVQQARLAESQAQEEVTTLKRSLLDRAKVERQNEQLRQQVQELERSSKTDREMLSRENAELRERLSTLRIEVNTSATDDRNSLRMEIAALKDRLTATKANEEAAKAELQAFQRDPTRSDAEVQLEEAENHIATMKARCACELNDVQALLRQEVSVAEQQGRRLADERIMRQEVAEKKVNDSDFYKEECRLMQETLRFLEDSQAAAVEEGFHNVMHMSVCPPAGQQMKNSHLVLKVAAEGQKMKELYMAELSEIQTALRQEFQAVDVEIATMREFVLQRDEEIGAHRAEISTHETSVSHAEALAEEHQAHASSVNERYKQIRENRLVIEEELNAAETEHQQNQMDFKQVIAAEVEAREAERKAFKEEIRGVEDLHAAANQEEQSKFEQIIDDLTTRSKAAIEESRELFEEFVEYRQLVNLELDSGREAAAQAMDEMYRHQVANAENVASSAIKEAALAEQNCARFADRTCQMSAQHVKGEEEIATLQAMLEVTHEIHAASKIEADSGLETSRQNVEIAQEIRERSFRVEAMEAEAKALEYRSEFLNHATELDAHCEKLAQQACKMSVLEQSFAKENSELHTELHDFTDPETKQIYQLFSPRLPHPDRKVAGSTERRNSPSRAEELAAVAVSFLRDEAREGQMELQMYRAEFSAYQQQTLEYEIDAASSKKELSEVQAQCARLANRLCNLSEMEVRVAEDVQVQDLSSEDVQLREIFFGEEVKSLGFQIAWTMPIPVVDFVQPDGAAAQRGIHDGDHLMVVNESPTDGLCREELLPRLQERPLILKVLRRSSEMGALGQSVLTVRHLCQDHWENFLHIDDELERPP